MGHRGSERLGLILCAVYTAIIFYIYHEFTDAVLATRVYHGLATLWSKYNIIII